MRALMLAPIALVACGDNLPPGPDPNVLELEMHATIPANSEVEYCKFVEIPTTYITHDTIEFTGGSHHVLVFQTPYPSIPTHKDDGTPVDTSGVFDCTSGATNGWTVSKVIGGSQNRDGEALLSFPPGVGLHVGGVALINVHYINGFDQPLETDVRIAFDTLSSSEVTQEGDVLFLYNPLISVAPGQTSRAEWRCPVYRDIHIANVQSHMHARGVGYAARVDDQAPFYVNDRWEGVPVQHYDDLVVVAGSTFDYHCDYRNTTGRAIYQGPRTTDEMCMLIGSYYPRDARTANCLDPSGNLPGGNWVGQGTATCAATMGCMQSAQGDFHALTDCVLASKPLVSKQISDLLRCTFRAQNPLQECGPQIQACGAI
jgi:hypothetical protein